MEKEGKLATKTRALLALFTFGYLVAASIYFVSIGNEEFLGYIGGVSLVIIGIVATYRYTRVPDVLLSMLSLLFLLHILGGGVKVGGDVLYAYVVYPVPNPTGLTFLKFDQIVHAYGSGVAALISRHYLARFGVRGMPLALFAFLAAMGCGAANEIIELVAVLTDPNTGVGGYFNNAVDLVANMAGALLALALVSWLSKKPLE